MINLFKCKHPLQSLLVEKDSTIRVYNEEYFAVTYYFICNKCKKPVTKEYAKPRNPL